MRATELFDNYIFGTITPEEKTEFEVRLKSDIEFAAAFDKHKTLLESINQHEQRTHLKQILAVIHNQEFGKDAKILPIKETFIKKTRQNLCCCRFCSNICSFRNRYRFKYWWLFIKTTGQRHYRFRE